MNDQKIHTAILNGDSDAINRVITKYSKLLWSIADGVLGQTASVQDVEECVADVFIYLWKHPQRYDPSRGTLKTWLTIITRTKAIDRFRSITRRAADELDESVMAQELGVPEAIIADTEKAYLTAAVNALEEPDREILVRRYYCDQKPKEIAAVMHLSVKQVENRLYRTKLRLRKSITQCDREA